METIKMTKSIFGLLAILSTIIVLAITSCSSNKTLERDCILKKKEYQAFVEQHELEDDINDFLSN